MSVGCLEFAHVVYVIRPVDCVDAVNVGEQTDCPIFDGLYDYCSLSSGASLGVVCTIRGPSIRTLLIVCCSRAFRFRLEVESRACRYLRELGRRPSPRQEIGGVRVLLH
jgi:hypothetical protein